MEDNKFLFIFGAVLIVFLGFPIVMQMIRGQKPAPAVAGDANAAPSVPAEPAKTPPLLNEGNLIGSEWEVVVYGFPTKCTLAAGGVVYASNPMAKQLYGVDYVEEKWSVTHDKMRVSGTFGGQEQVFDFEIVGDQIWHRSKELNGQLVQIKRLR
ncbi:MAG: hypothetical protein GXY15_13970 [Candidatus Hydrogenedentes bacterium]|nr:hypothetical protein [Candidatus Hydrogenedentota bacterium]